MHCISQSDGNIKVTLKDTFVKIHWFLSSQLGFDPRHFLRAILGIPFFLRDWHKFRRGYAGKLTLMPCLHDRWKEGGTTNSEYFWQDLIVAQWIFAANPQRHVDIGSRVDGFVAHVASFREIEVFDARPITTQVPGVIFKKANLMLPLSLPSDGGGGYCDSLSCLHVIEHFGLGRYGDPVDTHGHKYGIANMARLLKPCGRLYISTPIGQERVEFNANRVFNPRTIIISAESAGLKLYTLTVISACGSVLEVEPNEDVLNELAQKDYNLGIFVFIKRDL